MKKMLLELHWIGLPVVEMIGYPAFWSSGIDRNTRGVAGSSYLDSGGDGGFAWLYQAKQLPVTGWSD